MQFLAILKYDHQEDDATLFYWEGGLSSLHDTAGLHWQFGLEVMNV